MIKEIKYNGYSANPSDYICPDGDLDMSLGVLQENEALRPLTEPTLRLQLPAGDAVIFIHETVRFKHYIIRKSNGELAWMNQTMDNIQVLHKPSGQVHRVTAVGNTLIALTSEGLHYYLWKGTGYASLGTEIPTPSLTFGLRGSMVRSEAFDINFDDIRNVDTYFELSEANKTKITEQVLAKVNKFIAEESTQKGKFIYPFLLRYALRLYDGTLTKHSAPILMVASSDLTPAVFCNSITTHDFVFNKAKLTVAAEIHEIDYAASTLLPQQLNPWKDIVRSVDVFVSKPIYTYDPNGQCPRFARTDGDQTFCICKHSREGRLRDKYTTYGRTEREEDKIEKYQLHAFNELYVRTFNYGSNNEIPAMRLLLPGYSKDQIKKEVKSCAHFYLLDSIKIDNLQTERTPIKVEENYLQTLTAREVMTDDYDSHDRITAQYAFPYNSRLNLAGIGKTLFKGHSPETQLCFSNGYKRILATDTTEREQFDYTIGIRITVYIKQDGKDIVVQSHMSNIGNKAPTLFFYYPNINAYKAIIEKRNYNVSTFYEIPLEKHDFLNGAFYFDGWDDLKTTTTTSVQPSSPEELTIDLNGKIYTSEINNPFHFPPLGINTVGTGRILGISAAAKALSEGQFGQFPLYAFTTEGVWALEVSATGTYSAKQPITRDVVINTNSITQIDSAVLFATDRGIMLISGSTVQCISDRLNTEELFRISDLPKCNELINIFNGKANENEQITLTNITLLPFSEFLTNCRMVYDYTNQHIIVYNPAIRYAYVYSLKSREWGMMRSDIVDNVNSYPEALAMADGSKLVDLSKPTASNTTAFVITRPFKIDAPNIFKTISTIIQRGIFDSTHVQQVLYGSNDLIHWHTVWSSVDKVMRGYRGTPYKAYRLALICKFDRGESIYGCTVVYDPRMTNQVR